MRRRASTVVAAAILVVGGLGGQSAYAAALPVCGGSTGSAGIPGNTCDVDVTAECPPGSSTTQVRYAVSPSATPASVDITWTNTPGNDVTVTNQPLSGTLTWPAPSARTATLVFGTNPSVSVDVVNACESRQGAVLASGPRTTRSSGVLAETGAAAGPALAIGAGALLVGGTSLVLLRRARRDSL